MPDATFATTKEQMIRRVISSLNSHGYSEDETRKRQFTDGLRKLMGGLITWNADIFVVNSNGTVLVGDVQMPEERRAQFIPAVMEQAVPKILSNFGPVSPVLFISVGGVLQPSTIQNAAKLGISVDAIDPAGAIHRILEPLTVCQTFAASPDERQTIQDQRSSGWVIPRVLVQQLSSVNNLEYSNTLQQFATDYFSAAIPVRLSVQYKLACKCIENIFRITYGLDPCCESIRGSMDLQKMARIKGETRDHFLHTFQTFLMGAIVLNNYIGSSSSPFVLCNRYPRMDLPWLIASIFHDYGFDYANLESCLPTTIGEFRYIPRMNLRFSPLLNSFYDFQRNDGDLDNWQPDSYQVQSHGLEHILFNAAIEKSSQTTGERLRAIHAVISAHEIIRLEEKVSVSRPNLKSEFINSALSASMHDKTLWTELFSQSIFPISARRFPLFYLLVLCDTLAEGGRPKTIKVTQQDAVLARFNVQNDTVGCAVWFSEPERACVMNFWASFVQNRCFTNPFLNLDCRSLS